MTLFVGRPKVSVEYYGALVQNNNLIYYLINWNLTVFRFSALWFVQNVDFLYNLYVKVKVIRYSPLLRETVG